jgi:hypothetical protein
MKWLIIVIGCIIGLAAMGGGAFLCYEATQRTTCSDWVEHGYVGYSCGYTTVNFIYQCDTVCTCQQFTNVVCLKDPPGGLSVNFLVGGIIIIIIGIISAIGSCIIYTKV